MNHPSLSRRSFFKLVATAITAWISNGCRGKAASPASPATAPASPSPSAAASPTQTALPTPIPATFTPPPTTTLSPTVTPEPSLTPSPTLTITPTPQPPTFTPTPLNPERTVSISQATSYDLKQVRQQVQAALEGIGGVGDLITPGASVAIKPNLTGGVWATGLIDRPPTESYVTHPAVVQAVGELLRDAGASKLYIVEGVADDQSYRQWGYEEAAQAMGATLIDLNQAAPYTSFASVAVGKGWQVYERFALHRLLTEVDVFVSVPKLKCHWTCGVTLAMKNLVGIAPIDYYRIKPEDTYRSSLHGLDKTGKSRIPKVAIDLVLARPINLSVIDGIKTVDGGEGPWEELGFQETNILIAGKNPLAADAVGTAVMGFDPTAECPDAPFFQTYNHLNIAANVGIGTNRLDEITVVGLPVEVVRRPFKPST